MDTAPSADLTPPGNNWAMTEDTLTETLGELLEQLRQQMAEDPEYITTGSREGLAALAAIVTHPDAMEIAGHDEVASAAYNRGRADGLKTDEVRKAELLKAAYADGQAAGLGEGRREAAQARRTGFDDGYAAGREAPRRLAECDQAAAERRVTEIVAAHAKGFAEGHAKGFAEGQKAAAKNHDNSWLEGWTARQEWERRTGTRPAAGSP